MNKDGQYLIQSMRRASQKISLDGKEWRLIRRIMVDFVVPFLVLADMGTPIFRGLSKLVQPLKFYDNTYEIDNYYYNTFS